MKARPSDFDLLDGIARNTTNERLKRSIMAVVEEARSAAAIREELATALATLRKLRPTRKDNKPFTPFKTRVRKPRCKGVVRFGAKDSASTRLCENSAKCDGYCFFHRHLAEKSGDNKETP